MQRQKDERPQKTQKHRTNRQIRVPYVQVIDHEGRKLGSIPTQEALRKAEDLGLDLVEMAATQNPPVCKIMDYGKFRYDESKKQKAAAQVQRANIAKLKTISVRPTTDVHDLEVRVNQLRSFVEQGHKVQFEVFMNGREKLHPDIATKLIQRVLGLVQDIATLETAPILNDKRMSATFGKKNVKKPGPHGPTP